MRLLGFPSFQYFVFIIIFFHFAAKHLYPFNDQVVVYVRYLGPGVLVGQAWQEGKVLEQVPRKLCAEILMIKDYSQRPLQKP